MQNRFTIAKSPILIAATLALFVASFTGCLPEDEIKVHRIAKSRSGLESLHAASEVKAEPATPTDRMVVGLYDLPDATWFFKINGTIQQVGETESEWRPFLKSVRFENGEPQWELPEGWSVGDQKPMRFATLVIGDGTPMLEMAISSLGPGQDLLLNVNRWRGQMGLSPAKAAELDNSVTPMELDSVKAWLFDVNGNKSGSMAPFANRPMASNSRPTSTAVGRPDVQFEPLEGWDSGKTSTMVPVRLQLSTGEGSAQITVIQLPAAANKWEPNVSRWAGEVGLAGLSADELAKRSSEIQIDGTEGNLLRLIEAENERATVGVMIKRGATAWFIKLTGDREIVSQNEDLFSKFLQSVKFPSQN